MCKAVGVQALPHWLHLLRGLFSVALLGPGLVWCVPRARLCMLVSRTSAATSNAPDMHSMLPKRTMPRSSRCPSSSSAAGAAPDMDVPRMVSPRLPEPRMECMRRAALGCEPPDGGPPRPLLLGAPDVSSSPAMGSLATENRTTGPERCSGSSDDPDGATEKRTRAIVEARGGLELPLSGSGTVGGGTAGGVTYVASAPGSLNVMPLVLEDERPMNAGDGRALLLLRDACGGWTMVTGVRGLVRAPLLLPRLSALGRPVEVPACGLTCRALTASTACCASSLAACSLAADWELPRKKEAAAPKKLCDREGDCVPSLLLLPSPTFFLMVSTAFCSLTVIFLMNPLGFFLVDLRMPPGTP